MLYPTLVPVTLPATTVFVKGSRYDKMIEAFGGVGVNATSPDELRRAVIVHRGELTPPYAYLERHTSAVSRTA